MQRTPIRSHSAWSETDRIHVKGFDLCQDLLGKVSLGDMAFLELTQRLPTKEESTVFNAMAITLVEHGLTPSALATRLTYAGAPEAMQAAVAAGLCGLGSVFVGSMEVAAKMLQEALRPHGLEPEKPGVLIKPHNIDQSELAIQTLAEQVVRTHRDRKAVIPGIGHHFHKPVDPRAPALFKIAIDNGFNGPYIALMKAVALQAETVYKKPLPVNATGAIAAIASELGLPWKIVRGVGVMARAIGLVGHVLEEMRQPIAREIKTRAEEEATEYARNQK